MFLLNNRTFFFSLTTTIVLTLGKGRLLYTLYVIYYYRNLRTGQPLYRRIPLGVSQSSHSVGATRTHTSWAFFEIFLTFFLVRSSSSLPLSFLSVLCLEGESLFRCRLPLLLFPSASTSRSRLFLGGQLPNDFFFNGTKGISIKLEVRNFSCC